MRTVTTTHPTEGAIWSRLLRPGRRTFPLEAARYFLQLEFPQPDKERMHELAAKARDATVSPAERQEMMNYERVGNLLALLKSRARQRLKSASRSNGSER